MGDAPKALVIAGPSGVGKGTLIEKLKAEFPDAFGFSVSHTTRAPRPGEENGVHYHFVERPAMEAEVKEGKFLEHADVHGNMYGTSFASVEAVGKKGKICILDIDVQGVRSCRKAKFDGIYVFIAPPSQEELEKRLRGRGTETEDKILKRLANAKGEIDAKDEPGLFDHQVVNEDLDKAYAALKEILKNNIDQATQIAVATKAAPQALVIAGPSGVGKGTLIEKLKAEFSDAFGFSVSHTTRAPRPGEENGVHYHFVERPAMEAEVKEGKFLEHADVHGNMYGTSFASVEAVGKKGKICILDIDVQGVRSCRKAKFDGIYVFIAPPSQEELEKRLRGRGTETEDKILKRLANAKGEIDAKDEPGLFDHQVVNEDLDKAYAALKEILKDNIQRTVGVDAATKAMEKTTL